MSVSSLADPCIRRLYGIADRKDVEVLQQKLEIQEKKVIELETQQKELLELVNTLRQEIEQLKNAKPAGSALENE